MSEHYIVVLPDGKELPYEYKPRSVFGKLSGKGICQEAIILSDVTTSRRDPQEVRVELFRLKIEKGALVRTSLGKFDAMPKVAAMDQQDYNEAMDEAVSHLPDEFKAFVCSQAWDRGHSSGYEEVVNIAQDLAHDLGIAFDKYMTRTGR